MALARSGGYKQRNVVVGAVLLSSRRDEEGPEGCETLVRHGFGTIEQLHVNARNSMVWCAGTLRRGGATAAGSRIVGFSTLGMSRPGQRRDDSSRDALMKHMLQASPG